MPVPSGCLSFYMQCCFYFSSFLVCNFVLKVETVYNCGYVITLIVCVPPDNNEAIHFLNGYFTQMFLLGFPVFASEVKAALECPTTSKIEDEKEKTESKKIASTSDLHHPLLLKVSLWILSCGIRSCCSPSLTNDTNLAVGQGAWVFPTGYYWLWTTGKATYNDLTI